MSLCSPQRSDSEGTVQLDGEGYAAVGRPTRWNPNVSTITFKFRTFSSEALLMYLATEDMVRSVCDCMSVTYIYIYCIYRYKFVIFLSTEGLLVSGAVRGQGESEL